MVRIMAGELSALANKAPEIRRRWIHDSKVNTICGGVQRKVDRFVPSANLFVGFVKPCLD